MLFLMGRTAQIAMEEKGMSKALSKKDLAADMYKKGLNVEAIAGLLRADPSYVANALIERGYVPNYVDLYTSTGPQNRYAAMLAGVLQFKDVEVARASVGRIGELYERFAEERDRRGLHQCEVLALIGKNRAEGLGKWREAQVFADWLAARLAVRPPEGDGGELPEAAAPAAGGPGAAAA
jgi:hypothetical protein